MDEGSTPLTAGRRLLLEAAFAAIVGFAVTLFVLSPRVSLLAYFFGVPLGILTWYLWDSDD